jgi:hypothetical protein
VSEPGVTNPWEPWQRLIDSIGPDYRAQLFRARDRAKGTLDDLGDEELASIASAGRRIASSLDEEGARLTVSLHADRERDSRSGPASCGTRPSSSVVRRDAGSHRGAVDMRGIRQQSKPPKQRSTGGSPMRRTGDCGSSATAVGTSSVVRAPRGRARPRPGGGGHARRRA